MFVIRLRTPTYCLHTPMDQVVFTIDGKDRYLGKHGTAESDPPEPQRRPHHSSVARRRHESRRRCARSPTPMWRPSPFRHWTAKLGALAPIQVSVSRI